MIEVVVRNLLKNHVQEAVFVEDEPKNSPAAFFLIHNTMNGAGYQVSNNLSIEAYAGSEVGAKEMIDNAIRIINFELISEETVSKVQFNTSYKNNDVDRKRYRRVAAWTVNLF